MISANNYFKEIENVDVSSLPADLKAGHAHVSKVTSKGKNWTAYETNPVVQDSIDRYFELLNAFLRKKTRATRTTSRSRTARKAANTRKRTVTSKRRTPLPKKPKARKPKTRKPLRRKVKKAAPRIYRFEGQQVERISEELKFIRRFVNMQGKSKTPDQIRLFVNALQKAMTEKRIRKTSVYASEILEIQDALISLFTKARGRKAVKVEIGEERRAHFLAITGKQRLLPSIRFIKSYIGLQGKKVQTASVKNLLLRIDKAIKIKAVPARDPYAKQVANIAESLRAFISKNKVEGTLSIPGRELNGLSGIVDVVEGVAGLDGFGDVYDEDDEIIKGHELAEMEFPTIGLTGKWRDFIGDPTRGFTAMVFGKPKFGKSMLCIDFADYLSRNHGEVLYVAKEERIGGTLQEKMRRSRAYDVSFTSKIPSDLSAFDFVFLDSITMLGLSTEDLEELREEYPEISFIFIFQTTKQGAFRGSNEYQHNVDIVIEIPEMGHAEQYGRFNAHSEMEIF